MLFPELLKTVLKISFVLILLSCQSAEPSLPEQSVREEAFNIRMLSEPEVIDNTVQGNADMSLPDLLYAGLQALDADRLLTPSDVSAHHFFSRALSKDPSSKIAQQGFKDIVKRYLQLAREAMRRGFFEEARQLISRAEIVDSEENEIALVKEELEAEIISGDVFYQLNNAAVSDHSVTAKLLLEDIARKARELDALFLITAPNDDQARWMFSVMREAVQGYRLRGNIELSGRVAVRLRLPVHGDE